MTAIVVPGVVRTVTEGTFTDLGVTVTRVLRQAGGTLVLMIDGEVTSEQREAVVRRCQTSPDGDELRAEVGAILAASDAFDALPEPTAEEVAAQVRMLTHALRVAIRLILRRL